MTRAEFDAERDRLLGIIGDRANEIAALKAQLVVDGLAASRVAEACEALHLDAEEQVSS